MANKNLQRMKNRKAHKYGEQKFNRRKPAIVISYGARDYVRLEGDTRAMVREMIAKLGIRPKDIFTAEDLK